ncbi:response regulator [Emticicia agri]|uniref:Response regulator n=1 Tax=Emticicia agri TaxID=2492393 RepID=A0A4Q5LSQ2_9BACT|nr:response regulator [Emticicia agri]RYU92601.1 response regulator [Emticicia agri]
MKTSHLHLLLADDDEDDRELFQDALNKIAVNTQLTTVNNGEELMEWLLQKQASLPDLLFLDLNMPRKSGYECLVEIKQQISLQALPVIILSSAIKPTEMDNLYQNGAQYYVHKPSSFKQLIQVIEQLLSLPEEKKQFQPIKENFIFN